MKKVGPGRIDPARRIQPAGIPSGPEPGDVARVERDIQWFRDRFDAEAMARLTRLIDKARFSTFDNLVYTDDPESRDAIFDYRVPDPNILGVYRLGLWFSEPAIADIVRPRIEISQAGLTNVVNVEDMLRTTNGNLAEPPKIDTVWIQSNERIRFIMIDVPDIRFRVGVHLIGRMYAPAAGGALAEDIV